jgi:predicted DNA-binding transcriptional regulator YafY
MPKRDQLRRLVEIDRRIRAGEFPHPDQLASDLEVARRVIFNDRAYLLDVLGAPLAFHKERRGWYYTEPTYALPTVSMTRPELLALVLAVEAAQRQWGKVVEKELLLAVEKIGQSLPEGHISVDLDALRR